jgi:hypothetical protein
MTAAAAVLLAPVSYRTTPLLQSSRCFVHDGDAAREGAKVVPVEGKSPSSAR